MNGSTDLQAVQNSVMQILTGHMGSLGPFHDTGNSRAKQGWKHVSAASLRVAEAGTQPLLGTAPLRIWQGHGGFRIGIGTDNPNEYLFHVPKGRESAPAAWQINAARAGGNAHDPRAALGNVIVAIAQGDLGMPSPATLLVRAKYSANPQAIPL